jgi:diguanylate cyclase (GGDEF)-like protein
MAEQGRRLSRAPSGRCRAVLALALLLGLASGSAVAHDGPRDSRDLVPRNIQFTHLSGEDGLSQAIVSDVVQDLRGYVWIATQEGLNRFDGYDVRVYEQRRGDEGTLPHDFVWVLHVDREGALWAGTAAGAVRYDPEGDRFERTPFGPGVSLSDPVRSLAATRDGSHWFGTDGSGLLRVGADGRARRFRHDPGDPTSLPGDTVLALYEDDMGNLWIGTAKGGLARWDAVSGTFQRYPAGGAPGSGLVGREVRVIHQDRAGQLWIGTGDAGLTRYDWRRGVFEHLSHEGDHLGELPSLRVRDVVEDERGTLWVATDGGLAEWRRSSQAFVAYGHQAAEPRTLRSDNVTSLLVDATGVLWVGTWDGVSRWNYVSDTFTYYDRSGGRLPGDRITAVAEDGGGHLWVATYGDGLARLDPVTGATRFYAHDPEDPASLPEDRVMAVHVDGRDRVWVGTRSAGLASLDPATGTFERFAHDPDDPRSLSTDAVTSILSDATGTLWVGTYGGGLDRLAPDTTGFDHFRHDPEDLRSLSGDRVLSLASDERGALWVGTAGNGLDWLDPETGRVSRFGEFELIGAGPGLGEEIAPETVTDLLRDPSGALWIGTLGQGLLRWDRTHRNRGTARVRVFGKAEGLPTDTIFGLLPGERGVLWISSNRGLTRFDPQTGGVRQFDSRNGLRDSEFNQGARLRSRSGRLLFGGTTGLVGFFPGDLPFNDRAPDLVVTASSRDARLVSAAPGQAVPPLEIGYLDRFLAFDFAALDFTSPDKNQYRYRLEGLEDEWILADRFRHAAYTNLPPGASRSACRPRTTTASGPRKAWRSRSRSCRRPGTRGTPTRCTRCCSWAPWASCCRASGRARLRRVGEQRVQLEKEVQVRTEELEARNRELEKLNDQLAEASITDSLTGLRNRRYVDQFIATELARFERSQTETALAGSDGREELLGRTMFFMMIDLDGFKQINDRFGHHAGDLALIQVTETLQSCCRASDTIVRWGGDEFMVIGVASGIFQAKVLAERIREAVAEQRYDVGEGRSGRLSASIGIAPYPLIERRYGFCSWELVSAVADQAAYLAKANGRNGWVCLVGSETLRREELDGVGSDLSGLVRDGAVVVDSSFSRDLRFPGSTEEVAGPGRA